MPTPTSPSSPSPPEALDTPAESEASGNKLAVEYGPILVFVLLYNYLRRDDPDGAIYTAAGVFAVVAVLALAWSRLKMGRWPGVLLFSTALVVVSVGLAWGFDDPRFFYMKPTVVYALFGVGALGGLLVGRNVIRMLLGNAYTLPERAWNTLAVRWGVFFFAMAALNEVVWRTMGEAFWANFKLFGFIPLTLLFAATQVPFLLRNGAMGSEGKEAAPERP